MNLPAWDAPLSSLDDHFLGARLLGPLKPAGGWLDVYDNVQQHASPGSLHAVHAESLASWDTVASSLQANTAKSLARPINYMGTQVCMGGGLPTCPKSIPVYQWEPQHEFRGLRHLIAWRRFGNPTDRFLAECAVSRITHEPTLADDPHNQREVGWPLLLLAEAVQHLPSLQSDIAIWITQLIDKLWVSHGDNYLCLLTLAQQKASNHLAVVSWQHAVLTRALGRLVLRGWADPRVAALYKVGVRGLDDMRQPGSSTWWVDWDPSTGSHVDAHTAYGGTSLWTAAAYAETLAVGLAGDAMRREYLLGFVAKSDALKPTDKNYDAGSHALIVACLAK